MPGPKAQLGERSEPPSHSLLSSLRLTLWLCVCVCCCSNNLLGTREKHSKPHASL